VNRKSTFSIVSFILVCLAAGFLTGCSSSSNNNGGGTTNPITVTLSTAPPTTMVTGANASIAATVANDSANAGVTWSCTPTSSCGSFSASSSASGTAVTYTAPSTATAVTITATSVTNTSVSATASVNVTAAVTSSTYVFYASGQEEINDGPNYYAVAGAITLDANGNVLGGEEDYNDGDGNTSPGEPSTPDTLSAAVAGTPGLSVDSTTGIGTLTVLSSNAGVGTTGVEVFAVQFVNANHALITQFDGTATSSGSLDLQTATAPSTSAPNFSFAITGVDNSYNSIAYGGVFTIGSSGASGVIDVNDNGNVVPTTTFSGVTLGTADSYGRAVVNGINNTYTSTAVTFALYPVGPEALRIIDVDTSDSAVGSIYGQGTTTFTTASLGSSVFTQIGQWSQVYATVGQFGTDGNGNLTSGIADDNELYNGLQQEDASITGTYGLSNTNNGYGGISISGDGDVATLGMYMTDPNLNLNDPNNTTTDLGGALLIDLDSGLPGGMGVITPQTDTTATDFTNNTNPYAAGFQNFNEFTSCGGCELDMVGPFTMASGLFDTDNAYDSDPFDTITGVESTGDIFSSTPQSVSAGYFSMSEGNSTPNPLDATIDGSSGYFDADIYQASATTLYWLNFDASSMFLGPIEQQGSLTGVPGAIKKAATKTQPQPKGQVRKSFGGHLN
jgi:hypothetical protein